MSPSSTGVCVCVCVCLFFLIEELALFVKNSQPKGELKQREKKKKI